MKKRKLLKTTKSSKGITLIALVITIIVLLILAGVTISAISGNENIMNKATEGKLNNEKSNAKETAMLKATELIQEYNYKIYVENDEETKTNYNNVQEYVADKLNNVSESDYTFKVKDNKLTVSDVNGKLAQGSIDENGSIIWEDIEEMEIPEELTLTADEQGKYNKIYVNYTLKGETTPTKCIVLYSDSENGLQIIPVNALSKTYTIGTSDSNLTSMEKFNTVKNQYNTLITDLNNLAKSYVDEQGIAKTARAIGTVPNDPDFDDAEDVTFGDYGPFKGVFNYYETYDEVRLKDVGALAASNYGEYWIADRDVWKNSYITIVLTYIGWDGNQNRYEAASMKYDGDKIGFTEETKKIRPIFCLNNVKITGGKGTSDEPYTLGV